MLIEIPGRDALEIRTIVFDYNGTLATDGAVPKKVQDRIRQLAGHYSLYALTADTYGTAAKHIAGLPIELRTFPSGAAGPEKAAIVKALYPQHCACLGNGFNDRMMFDACALSVAVMDEEGVCAKLLPHADLVVRGICSAMDLFLKPARITAGLRH